jgi:hypothetical protein
MPKLVLIADLVASRAVPDRGALQTQLQQLLAELNQRRQCLSPYTLTLGDEFQALPGNAEQVFQDTAIIQAALYPVRVRFSLAVGEISTDINPHQALGMDGPAFYAARAGIELLKRQRGLYHISGLREDISGLANTSLQLLSHSLGKWKQHRLAIMAALGQQHKVQDIAAQLGISDKAVYKSIRDGGVAYALALFEHLAVLIDKALEPHGISAVS